MCQLVYSTFDTLTLIQTRNRTAVMICVSVYIPVHWNWGNAHWNWGLGAGPASIGARCNLM